MPFSSSSRSVPLDASLTLVHAQGLQVFRWPNIFPEAFSTILKGIRCLHLPLVFLH